MDDTRKEHLRQLGKQRWAQAETIGTHLGISKHDVIFYLYREMQDVGLLDDAVAGNNLDKVRELRGWENLHRKNDVVEPVRTRLREDEIDDDDGPTYLDEFDSIRTALWFIAKLGSVEQAQRAINAAAKSLEVFREPWRVPGEQPV